MGELPVKRNEMKSINSINLNNEQRLKYFQNIRRQSKEDQYRCFEMLFKVIHV